MPIIPPRISMVTPRMIHYIQCLLIDVGLADRERALAHVRDITATQIKALDELTYIDGSRVIAKLRQWKESQRIPRIEVEEE